MKIDERAEEPDQVIKIKKHKLDHIVTNTNDLKRL
jgi:hypothetical protein